MSPVRSARLSGGEGTPVRMGNLDLRGARQGAPKLLARQFDPAAPNLSDDSDIGYIRTTAGRLYLAVVLGVLFADHCM